MLNSKKKAFDKILLSGISNNFILNSKDKKEYFNNPVKKVEKALFVSPFARFKNKYRLRNLVKINRSEVELYKKKYGALSEFILDFESFDYNKNELEISDLTSVLEGFINLLKNNPNEIIKILNSLEKNKGYTSEIATIYSKIDNNVDSKNLDFLSICSILLMLNSYLMCASNDAMRPGDEGPGGENDPGNDNGNDPDPDEDPEGGAGGENPESDEDFPEDEDNDFEQD